MRLVLLLCILGPDRGGLEIVCLGTTGSGISSLVLRFTFEDVLRPSIFAVDLLQTEYVLSSLGAANAPPVGEPMHFGRCFAADILGGLVGGIG
ncbi:hypothetical protein Nepgr_030118 [Nepenthes gracilis]|uniref:Secreted protein n=1 Tax=Nepenthes gracilis TaxID=150966 RepID=A0AAD3Y5I5_NEPGR|nr:hypothetical protein Nepgr_030118 [Nepenthes gracilis]